MEEYEYWYVAIFCFCGHFYENFLRNIVMVVKMQILEPDYLGLHLYPNN